MTQEQSERIEAALVKLTELENLRRQDFEQERADSTAFAKQLDEKWASFNQDSKAMLERMKVKRAEHLERLRCAAEQLAAVSNRIPEAYQKEAELFEVLANSGWDRFTQGGRK